VRSLISVISDTVSELKRIQGATIREKGEGDPFPLPRMIGAGDGRGIIISRKADTLIAAVSRQLKLDDPNLAQRVADEEWNATVRAAFGAPLAKIDLDDDVQSNARAVLDEVKTSINRDASFDDVREHAFGCTLFNPEMKIGSFSFGPVRFESRLEWLKRKKSESEVSPTTYRRIERLWRDGCRPSKRKSSFDAIRERSIVDTIGSAPYVCSVQTSGFASEAGFERALTAARLALSSIALLWEMPSRVLEGLNLTYDRSVVLQRRLSFVAGATVLSGGKLSHRPYGPHLKAEEWERLFTEAADHFRAIGEIFDYFLSPTGKAARPRLMSSLFQALLWFHEGCRETVTLMAIVKFSAAMDALGGGRKASGICQIMNARLGIKDNELLYPDGPTMRAAVDRIYSEGRSRTIHGTNDKVGHDWSSVRSLAERLAKMCLVACIDWTAKNLSSDDPALLKT
jgi:hypothetical protein